MSATVVHIILSYLTANVTGNTLRLQVYTRSAAADDLIKGISYRFSTLSLASLHPAKLGTGNRVKPRQLM